MKYNNILKGVFLDRPNRFIAHVKIEPADALALENQLKASGILCSVPCGVISVHVKNTGRCKELLVPGAPVILQFFPASLEAQKIDSAEAKSNTRKMAYDLISVYKECSDSQIRLINMDSQAPNKAVYEWLQKGADNVFGKIKTIRPETTYGSSRFDFYLETSRKKIFLEVKGVTLEQDGIVSFPDAPTERGTKHLQELSKALQDGYQTAVLFVIQMSKIRYFTPATVQDPIFAETLSDAKKSGVKVLAYDCLVTEDEMILHAPIRTKI
ncbi:MAG: DNA/RNA nuclease SfsA [Lachnospiraceae bacterium]|nr:DNA/RNA nuclease SfsA [Lachnospiraceae bacterium]